MELSLDKKRLSSILLITCCLFFLLPIFIEDIPLTFFAPALIIAIYQLSLSSCLLLAIGCGLVNDVFSDFQHIGMYAASYCITEWILYPQKRHYFADNLSTLPIMTFYFGVLSTVFLAILMYLVEMVNVISWPWIFTDILCMPALDAFFAFVFFVLPTVIFGKRRRRGKDYFS